MARERTKRAYVSASGRAPVDNQELGTNTASLRVHFPWADAARTARRGRADRGPTAYQERKHDGAAGASHGAVAFSGPGKTKPRQWRGLAVLRSGARRSQEQGESRMTVLPGARNRKVAGAAAIPRGRGKGYSQYGRE